MSEGISMVRFRNRENLRDISIKNEDLELGFKPLCDYKELKHDI
jgi:hypothetical protein